MIENRVPNIENRVPRIKKISREVSMKFSQKIFRSIPGT